MELCLNHCMAIALLGTANQHQHSLQDRTPIPHGYLRHVVNRCVLMAVKRSYDLSRLPWSSGKGQCPLFECGITMLL